MKNLKKAASLLLALLIVLAMVPAAFAAGATGSITVNGIQKDDKDKLTATYAVYKILHLESYDTTEKTYSYEVEEAWKAFFTRSDIRDYVDLQTEKDSEGNEVIPQDLYIKGWKGSDDDERVAAFAKLALAYASAHDNIKPVQTMAKGTEVSTAFLEFKDLPLGYYLIDSTVGALCGLTTTNPDASINAKNGAPTVDKQVKEDSTNQWADSNTADIGQTVDFRTTINVHAGAQNYVLHDKMDNGLKFDKTSVIAYHVVPGTTDGTGTQVPTKYFTVETENLGDGCTFHVVFTEDFCEHLETNDKVIVHYSAMLTRDAVISGAGNINEAWLNFGEENTTTHDTTTTKSFSIDIVKTDSQNTLINGAEFKIYDAATGGNEVAVVPKETRQVTAGEKGNYTYDQATDTYTRVENGNLIATSYRRARPNETGVDIIVKDGKIRVYGFDNGTYYLEETKAPSGYNQLTTRQKFIISDANLEAVFNGDIYSTGSGVHVVNKSGTMLPETGGIGTTLFYVVGGVLVAAAVVLLVTRKRMSEK